MSYKESGGEVGGLLKRGVVGADWPGGGGGGGFWGGGGGGASGVGGGGGGVISF